MEKIRIRIVKTDPAAIVPTFGTASAAGADLYACLGREISIRPGGTEMIPTGICLEIPEGYVGLVCARSGLAAKRGLAPANKVGVIDSDYRGELYVALYNHGREAAGIAPGERIAQLLIVPTPAFDFVVAESLTETERGGGGFGSTGRK